MNNHKYLFLLLTLYLLLNLSGCRDWFGSGAEPLPNSIEDQTLLAIIEITSPQYASVWKRGDSMPIQWVTSGPIQKVDIELYRKSTFQFKLIEGKVNDGLFYWQIPETINLSLHYRIKIVNHDKVSEYNICRSFQIEE